MKHDMCHLLFFFFGMEKDDDNKGIKKEKDLQFLNHMNKNEIFLFIIHFF